MKQPGERATHGGPCGQTAGKSGAITSPERGQPKGVPAAETAGKTVAPKGPGGGDLGGPDGAKPGDRIVKTIHVLPRDPGHNGDPIGPSHGLTPMSSPCGTPSVLPSSPVDCCRSPVLPVCLKAGNPDPSEVPSDVARHGYTCAGARQNSVPASGSHCGRPEVSTEDRCVQGAMCPVSVPEVAVPEGSVQGGPQRNRDANDEGKGLAAGPGPQREGGARRERGPHPAVGSDCIDDTVTAEKEDGPVVGEPLSRADLLLRRVYGDFSRDGDGCDLDRGIQGDQVWQSRWRRLAALTFPRNMVPQGKQGNAFLLELAAELDGVREGKWNSERPLVFFAVMLQRSPGVTRAKDIRAAIQQRLRMWQEAKYDALVDNAESIAWNNASTKPSATSEDSAARKFNAKVISGRLRQAVRELTSKAGGGSFVSGRDRCQIWKEGIRSPIRQTPPGAGTECRSDVRLRYVPGSCAPLADARGRGDCSPEDVWISGPPRSRCRASEGHVHATRSGL